jgi:hypothetical protein
MDPYSRNPFRVLGLRSDASAREVARSSDRLLKWIELGETPTAEDLLPYLQAPERGREGIKQSVTQIDNPRSRITMELFWPAAGNSHYQTCCEHLKQRQYAEFTSLCEYGIAKEDLHEGRGNAIGLSERQDASLCRHFLAVFFHSAAISNFSGDLEKAKGARPAADWQRAFQCWTMVWRDDGFWEYLGNRARMLNDPRLAGFDVTHLRSQLPQLLLEVNSSLGVAALAQHKSSEFVANARVIRKSPFSQGEQERALKQLATPLLSQFEEALKTVMPRLSESAAREAAATLRQLPEGGFESTIDPDKFNAYYTTVESSIYKSLIPIGELIKRADLTVLESAREALDNLAYALRRLSLTANNVGDRPQKALEITRTAKGFGKSVECTRRLLEDETALQFLVLQKEAVEAANVKQFDKAILKLQESRKYANPEEQKTVDEWIEATKKRAVLGSAKPINGAPTMHTFNGIGTTLYGKRGFDQATQTYISTLFFVLLFIPIFPIAAYRVRHVGGNQYQFFGKVPLTKWAFLPLMLFVGLFLYASISDSFDSHVSSSVGTSAPQYAPTSPSSSTPQEGPAYRTAQPSSTPPATQSKPFDSSQYSSEGSGAKRELSKWLDHERDRLRAEEAQLDEMKSDIERERTLLKVQYNSLGDAPTEDEVDSYKTMEGRFNVRVERFNNLLESHHSSVQQFNSEVQRYNSMP